MKTPYEQGYALGQRFWPADRHWSAVSVLKALIAMLEMAPPFAEEQARLAWCVGVLEGLADRWRVLDQEA
jgi:hypothetical protein